MANLSTILKRDTAGRVATDGISNLAVTGSKIADDTISHTKIIPGYGLVPTGTIIAYAKNATPPGGWLQCNGSSISKTTYADLFDVIGVTFGGTSTGTTFDLPDLRGVFIRGSSSQTITDLRGVSRTYTGTFAQIKSDSVQRIQGSAELGTGSFGVPTQNETGVFIDSLGAFGGTGAANQPTFGSGAYQRTLKFDSADSVSSGTETAPANIALLYCIKY
jgi:microcystin-dependent protein